VSDLYFATQVIENRKRFSVLASMAFRLRHHNCVNNCETTLKVIDEADNLSFFAHVNPLTPTVAIMDTAIKHPVPNRVKPNF